MLSKSLAIFTLLTSQSSNSECFSPSAILTSQRQLALTLLVSSPIKRARPHDVATIKQAQQLVKFYLRGVVVVRAFSSAPNREGRSDPGLPA